MVVWWLICFLFFLFFLLFSLLSFLLVRPHCVENKYTSADLSLFFYRALPILRQLGTQGGAGALMHGGEIDLSMIKVWAGLEARKFFQASVGSVEACVSYDLLSPNI